MPCGIILEIYYALSLYHVTIKHIEHNNLKYKTSVALGTQENHPCPVLTGGLCVPVVNNSENRCRELAGANIIVHHIT